MTFTKVADDFNDRPDLLLCSRSARLLHIEALVYCNRHLTDGRLPAAVLGRISDADDPVADAQELEAAGVWELVDDRSWSIDWRDQEPSEDVRIRRDNSAQRSRRYRRHVAGNHDLCDPKRCREAAAVTRDEQRVVHSDATRRDTVYDTPSLPSRPPRPRKGVGGGGERPEGRCPHLYPLDDDGDTGCPKCTAASYARAAQ